MHLQRVPSPIPLVVHCNSVHSKAYAFGFLCISLAGKLRITYEGTVSVDERMATTAA
jgi:hypothetical protein